MSIPTRPAIVPTFRPGDAAWTGIGAAGTAIVGMAFLGEPAQPARLLCIVAILAGVIGLKLAPG